MTPGPGQYEDTPNTKQARILSTYKTCGVPSFGIGKRYKDKPKAHGIQFIHYLLYGLIDTPGPGSYKLVSDFDIPKMDGRKRFSRLKTRNQAITKLET
jgi:hypothetical protein